MAAGEVRILEFLERDPSQGRVDPEVVVTALEGESQGITRLLGVAGLQSSTPSA